MQDPTESTINVEVGFLIAFLRNLDSDLHPWGGGLSRKTCLDLFRLLEEVSSFVHEKLVAIWHGLGGQTSIEMEDALMRRKMR